MFFDTRSDSQLIDLNEKFIVKTTEVNVLTKQRQLTNAQLEESNQLQQEFLDSLKGAIAMNGQLQVKLADAIKEIGRLEESEKDRGGLLVWRKDQVEKMELEVKSLGDVIKHAKEDLKTLEKTLKAEVHSWQQRAEKCETEPAQPGPRRKKTKMFAHPFASAKKAEKVESANELCHP